MRSAVQRILACCLLWPCRRHPQELDSEGRVVVTDHGAFVLFNLYGAHASGSVSVG